MFFWIHEDRCGPDGTRLIKFMPFPWATCTFCFLVLEEIIKTMVFRERTGEQWSPVSLNRKQGESGEKVVAKKIDSKNEEKIPTRYLGA